MVWPVVPPGIIARAAWPWPHAHTHTHCWHSLSATAVGLGKRGRERDCFCEEVAFGLARRVVVWRSGVVCTAQGASTAQHSGCVSRAVTYATVTAICIELCAMPPRPAVPLVHASVTNAVLHDICMVWCGSATRGFFTVTVQPCYTPPPPPPPLLTPPKPAWSRASRSRLATEAASRHPTLFSWHCTDGLRHIRYWHCTRPAC